MPDRYFGRIHIWGKIQEKDLQELADEISNMCMEEINEDYSVKGSDAEAILKTLRGSAEGKDAWQGQDSEASYGHFADLENWIHKYPGLNYLRYSGSYYDTGPSEEWSVDGSVDSAYYTADDEAYMTHSSIRHFMEVLGSFEEEDAPKLMNDKGWAEEFIAKFYLENGKVPTIIDYLDSEGAAPTPGILEIV